MDLLQINLGLHTPKRGQQPTHEDVLVWVRAKKEEACKKRREFQEKHRAELEAYKRREREKELAELQKKDEKIEADNISAAAQSDFASAIERGTDILAKHYLTLRDYFLIT